MRNKEGAEGEEGERERERAAPVPFTLHGRHWKFRISKLRFLLSAFWLSGSLLLAFCLLVLLLAFCFFLPFLISAFPAFCNIVPELLGVVVS